MRQQHVKFDPAKQSTEDAAGPLALDVGARGFDQLAVGHAGGHTVSQARQPRQRSRWAAAESVRPMRPSAMDLMRKIRPRGESISVPRLGEGRAVRQAEAAVHAAVDALDVVPVQRGAAPRRGAVVGRVACAMRVRFLPRSGPG